MSGWKRRRPSGKTGLWRRRRGQDRKNSKVAVLAKPLAYLGRPCAKSGYARRCGNSKAPCGAATRGRGSIGGAGSSTERSGTVRFVSRRRPPLPNSAMLRRSRIVAIVVNVGQRNLAGRGSEGECGGTSGGDGQFLPQESTCCFGCVPAFQRDLFFMHCCPRPRAYLGRRRRTPGPLHTQVQRAVHCALTGL